MTTSSNPDVGPRCGACRLGLVVHEPSDPQCFWYEEDEFDSTVQQPVHD